MAGAGIEFELYDHQTNETIVLHGVIEGVETEWGTVVNTTSFLGNHTTAKDPEYDGTGALLFVVAVISVYSLSMFMIIVTLARRKSEHKNMDMEVDRYMKGLDSARQRAREESVLRMRLRWPGNFIWLRFTNRPDRELPRDIEEKDEEDDEARSESSGSFIELPATTVSCGRDEESITSAVPDSTRTPRHNVSKTRPKSHPLPLESASGVSDAYLCPPCEGSNFEELNGCSRDWNSESHSGYNIGPKSQACRDKTTHAKRLLWRSQRSPAIDVQQYTSFQAELGSDSAEEDNSECSAVPLQHQLVRFQTSSGVQGRRGPTDRDSSTSKPSQQGASNNTAPYWKRSPMYLSSDAFYSHYVAKKGDSSIPQKHDKTRAPPRTDYLRVNREQII